METLNPLALPELPVLEVQFLYIPVKVFNQGKSNTSYAIPNVPIFRVNDSARMLINTEVQVFLSVLESVEHLSNQRIFHTDGGINYLKAQRPTPVYGTSPDNLERVANRRRLLDINNVGIYVTFTLSKASYAILYNDTFSLLNSLNNGE